MKTKFLAGVLALGALGWGQAYAASYCVNSPPVGVALTDVNFTIEADPSVTYKPIDCYGIVDGNDDLAGINAIVENTVLDPVPDDPTYGWDGDFGVKVEDDGNVDRFVGLEFTLESDVDVVSGDWTLTWADVDITTEPDYTLPATLDMIVVLKASDGFIAYLFDNVVFTIDPVTGAGEFTVKITNKNNEFQQLSHLTVYLRDEGGNTPGDDDDVPEPGSLALFGIGFLAAAMGGLRRRRH